MLTLAPAWVHVLLQRERRTKTQFSNFGQIGHTVFEKLPLIDSLNFIVFANMLIKLKGHWTIF